MTPRAPPGGLAELLGQKQVVVCCGAGGVGKTTTAAALGLAAARQGRSVLVLTIDPARRLSQALGLQGPARGPTPVPLEGDGPGRLEAWTLEPGLVFEDLVRRLAPSPAQARRILESRLFGHLSELVAGMQEYSAAEALWELVQTGRYQLVILDTPPSRHALDFLEAPSTLARFLDERILGLFLPASSGLWRRATEVVGSVFTRVLGNEVFAELQEFLSALRGMFGPLRRHAEGVRSLLSSEAAAFLLVTSPEQTALQETRWFRDRLQAMGLPFAGFILNRSWDAPPGAEAPAAPPDATAATRSALEKLAALAERERARAARDRALLGALAGDIPGGRGLAVAVPDVGEAVEDLTGLAAVSRALTVKVGE